MVTLPISGSRREDADRPCAHVVRRIGRLAGLVLFAAATPATAQTLPTLPTLAGTSIVSLVTVSFVASDGLRYTVADSEGGGNMVVARVAGVGLDTTGRATVNPGTIATFQQTLRNLGNAADSFAVAAHATAAWPVHVYLDANRNGALDAGDAPVNGPIALGYGEIAKLIITVNVPLGTTGSGTADTVTLVAQSLFDPVVGSSVTDQVSVRGANIAVTLAKSVDRATATTGDVLTYTIAYRATGTTSATNLRIIDAIPAGTSYLAGTTRLNGVVLADGTDSFTFDPSKNRIVVTLPVINAGDGGEVTFQVRVGT